MAKTSFYVDNANRDYPFLAGASFAPLSSVVGCGFVLGHGTGFLPGQHSVFLTEVKRIDGYLWFYFSSDAPGLAEKTIIFSRSESASPWEIEYADLLEDDPSSDSMSESSSESFGIDTGECGFPDAFAGFLITGPLDALLSTLAEGESIVGESAVEPALLQDLTGTYARTINIANADRTRYESPVDCPATTFSVTPRPMYTGNSCLKGPIIFTPGYNSLILQNNFANSITFSAASGAGDGKPCTQVPVFEGEEPPDDSIFLEGGPSCAEVVRMVAGVSGPLVPLEGGNGVSVTFQPELNAIKLNIDLHNLSVCSGSMVADS